MMENTAPLHAQKVTILSRLIKESSLTLEEALLLLKEEEQELQIAKSTTSPWISGTTTPYTQPIGVWPYGGTLTVSTSGNVGISNINPASSLTISTSTDTADLNN